MDTSHVEKVDLSHVPDSFVNSYKALLRKYADVFSKHDLDVGHSKTLPHQVRLTDPNRVVSINQYRLPYHLKEIAIVCFVCLFLKEPLFKRGCGRAPLYEVPVLSLIHI